MSGYTPLYGGLNICLDIDTNGEDGEKCWVSGHEITINIRKPDPIGLRKDNYCIKSILHAINILYFNCHKQQYTCYKCTAFRLYVYIFWGGYTIDVINSYLHRSEHSDFTTYRQTVNYYSTVMYYSTYISIQTHNK